MRNPLVSVIIPNYCHAKYLDQRIQSVLDQTYQNFEIIILDDCSPDDGASRTVIEKYRTNPHVTHIEYNELNSGSTFKQWHKGFSLAKGDLIWIAESDDACHESMLQKLVHEFELYEDCVIAYSTLVEMDTDGNLKRTPASKSTQHYSGKHYLKHYLALANFIRNASGAVFKKSALKNVDNSYMNFVGAGDYLFWVEIARQGSVSIINQQLNYFRRHEGVVTEKRDADGSNFSAEKEIYEHIKTLVFMDCFHTKLAYAYRARRIRGMKFISDDVTDKIKTTWNVHPNFSLADKIVLRIFFSCLYRFNYYI